MIRSVDPFFNFKKGFIILSVLAYMAPGGFCHGHSQSSFQKQRDMIQRSPQRFKSAVLLHCLNKITGRVMEIQAGVGEDVDFETIRFRVTQCRVSDPEDPPESLAYIEISERKGAAFYHPIFKGWMFASSPSVSALEHPVYDVWVGGCQGDDLTTIPKPFDAFTKKHEESPDDMPKEEEAEDLQDFDDPDI